MERQHVRGGVTNFENTVQGRVDSRMPHGKHLHLTGGAVNHFQSFAPDIRRLFDFLFATHGKHGKSVN